MIPITINGQSFDPSKLSIGIQDVSASDAGRDQTGTMWKMLITRKYKIELEWWCPSVEETARILGAVQQEYFNVTFHDPLNPDPNSVVTKTMYVGDRSAPVQMWGDDRRFYSSVKFNLIEQ